MAVSIMDEHLRKYIEDGSKRQIRLTNVINDYIDQEFKSRERVIDQVNLIERMTLKNQLQSTINKVIARKDNDVIALNRILQYLEDTKASKELLITTMSAHLEELSASEIEAGGFVTHSIGVNGGAILDPATMIVNMKYDSRVEIAIGVRLNQWRDSSQFTIHKIKGQV